MKFNLTKIYYLFLGFILFVPSLTQAAWSWGDNIVPCKDDCNFNYIIKLIDNILNFFILLSIPMATLVFAWVGWTFIVNGDNSSKREGAKKALFSLLTGLFFVLGAWLIVKLIVSGLVKDTFIQDFTGLK